ncbi:PleD family two-component system response regulator [Gimesia aquarii]|uniref:DNA-binding response regulator MtrA n=1 Tax=Gimesia aquarii TaxID=2527964 RepID=A0A517X032_9PLAN|nr:response regulator [Gimesia aquarii]QDU10865.1 DNA-binding response regulator MtrA [Gimesia aquarii]
MTYKTVMIADDDHDLTQALALRLRPLGFSVMRSPDASHALIGAMKILPDMIVLDVDMPNGNGLAVCEMLSSDVRFHNIPIIIHTGYSDQATIDRCTQLGAFYIHKCPGSPATITEVARRFLQTDSEQEVEMLDACNKSSTNGEFGFLF